MVPIKPYFDVQVHPSTHRPHLIAPMIQVIGETFDARLAPARR